MYSVGIDVSADFFTSSCVDREYKTLFFGRNYDQNEAGWQAFVTYLSEQGITIENSRVCMESTGVYSEKLSYFLYHAGFQVYAEPPNKIKRAFYDEEKTDPIDSRQIAEYPFRFPDKLHAWQPRNEIVYQIDSLLTTREQLVRLRTACKNSVKSLKRKHHRQEELEEVFLELSKDLQKRITALEKEMDRLIRTNPELWRKSKNVLSIPNIGPLMNYNLIVISNGYTDVRKYTSLARFLGVSPLRHDTGKTKRKRKADGRGPARMRKLLYLAAMRMMRSHPKYKKYYDRKEIEGKEGRLILNNIENNLLRLIVGVLKSDKPYMKDYQGLPPDF